MPPQDLCTRNRDYVRWTALSSETRGRRKLRWEWYMPHQDLCTRNRDYVRWTALSSETRGRRKLRWAG